MLNQDKCDLKHMPATPMSQEEMRAQCDLVADACDGDPGEKEEVAVKQVCEFCLKNEVDEPGIICRPCCERISDRTDKTDQINSCDW